MGDDDMNECDELEMQEPITQGDITLHGDIGALFGALAKAQSELGPAIKGSVNPHFKSKYADLAANLEAALPVLAKHGLSIVQIPGNRDGLITVTTILGHQSGAYIRGVFGMTPNKPGPHAVASVVTYCRRYALAVYGAFADDDDANEAQNQGKVEADIETVKAKLSKAKDLRKAWESLTPAERKAIATNAADWWQELKAARA